MKIQINNSKVYINSSEAEEARDEFLSLIYHARNKETFGGYDKWKECLTGIIAAIGCRCALTSCLAPVRVQELEKNA